MLHWHRLAVRGGGGGRGEEGWGGGGRGEEGWGGEGDDKHTVRRHSESPVKWLKHYKKMKWTPAEQQIQEDENGGRSCHEVRCCLDDQQRRSSWNIWRRMEWKEGEKNWESLYSPAGVAAGNQFTLMVNEAVTPPPLEPPPPSKKKKSELFLSYSCVWKQNKSDFNGVETKTENINVITINKKTKRLTI